MKQFFLPLAEPLGAVWFLLLANLGWLLWRRQWRSAVWLGWPLLLIFALGSTPLAEGLVASAESPYVNASIAHLMVPGDHVNGSQPSNLNAHYDAVVLLGGGYYASEYDAYGFALDDGASRLVTGLELFRSGKAQHLVIGGSAPVAGETNLVLSDRVVKWAGSFENIRRGPSISTSLSSPPEERTTSEEPQRIADALAPRSVGIPVTTLGLCRDTHDEAIAFHRLRDSNHWQTVLLVTSALHMPRSAALFKRQGLEVVPVACDFQACGVPSAAFSPFPRQARLELLGRYLHEKIGWVIYKLRGWI